MSEANFQTVKLTKGSHRTPDEGVCVMELTSMLAGEPFGDHPRSACPVIGSFLRTYNDRIGDGRRQDLYELAAKVVDSRGGRRSRRARAARCRAWARERDSTTRISNRIGGPAAGGREAAVIATACGDDAAHRQALALVDELLRIGRERDRRPVESRVLPGADQQSRIVAR
jgi:phage terminase large subunit-like protein